MHKKTQKWLLIGAHDLPDVWTCHCLAQLGLVSMCMAVGPSLILRPLASQGSSTNRHVCMLKCLHESRICSNLSGGRRCSSHRSAHDNGFCPRADSFEDTHHPRPLHAAKQYNYWSWSGKCQATLGKLFVVWSGTLCYVHFVEHTIPLTGSAKCDLQEHIMPYQTKTLSLVIFSWCIVRKERIYQASLRCLLQCQSCAPCKKCCTCTQWSWWCSQSTGSLNWIESPESFFHQPLLEPKVYWVSAWASWQSVKVA